MEKSSLNIQAQQRFPFSDSHGRSSWNGVDLTVPYGYSFSFPGGQKVVSGRRRISNREHDEPLQPAKPTLSRPFERDTILTLSCTPLGFPFCLEALWMM